MDLNPYNIAWHCDDLKLSVAAVCLNNFNEFPQNKYEQEGKKKKAFRVKRYRWKLMEYLKQSTQIHINANDSK